MHCSARLLNHYLLPAKPLLASALSSSSSPSNSNPNPIFRRDFISSTLLSLLVSSPINPLKAEEITSSAPPNCLDPSPTKQAFLDISIDGEPVGFSKIVSGAAGVSYRRKEFVKIMPNYAQHGGLRSYGVDAELASKTGSNLAAETLVDEWVKQNENSCGGAGATKNVAKSVSIIVRDPSKPPPKLKLVARKGKLEIDEEEVGSEPNGTEFVITTKDSPELDGSALVVGRVLQGMEVVERIGQVKTGQENSTSPYFRVAKLIGDKRAVVAERGFNRPYSKVLITNCGLMG